MIENNYKLVRYWANGLKFKFKPIIQDTSLGYNSPNTFKTLPLINFPVESDILLMKLFKEALE